MASKSKLGGEKIWNFTVSDPTLHHEGFTIYKVTCKVFLLRAPESLTEIITWKRYNDFKQLFKSMSSLHKALHRKEQFPTFAKPKLFGRFDEAVIEERRLSALAVLEFIGSHSYLYKSKDFIAFLKNGKIKQGLSGSVLKPSRLEFLQSDEYPVEEGGGGDGTLQPTKHPPETNMDATEEVQEEEKENGENSDGYLEGVWNYPQVPDNISVNSYDDTDTSEVESALGTPLPDSEISFFDPLSTEDSLEKPSLTPELRTSSSWLFAAMNTCAEMEQNSDTDHRSDLTESENGIQITFSNSQYTHRRESQDSSEDCKFCASPKRESSRNSSLASSSTDLSDLDPLKARSGSKVEIGKGDIDLSDTFDEKSVSNHSAMTSATSSPNRQGSLGLFKKKPRSLTGESVSTMDLGGKEDYIHLAANQICLAQNCEAASKFDKAFAHYKTGVGILLQGVQTDKNKARRDAVRRKTAQYLLKAEDLYNRHLSKEILDDKRWAENSKLSPSCELDPSISLLKASSLELRNFKVLGTINKVLLVMDKTTDETYVMKTIHKSSVLSRKIKTIFPSNCPYMVSLYKFYETDYAIHLLLQHATGGKLWNYIGAYLQGHVGKDKNDDDAAHFGNVYAGTKLHSHDNSSQPCENKTESRTVSECYMAADASNDILIKFLQKDGEGEIKICTDSKSQDDKLDTKKNADTIDYDRLESFSSAEDGSENNDFKPSSVDQKDSVFQELLQDSKTKLEQFSINSGDSIGSDCRTRVDSFVFDKKNVIQEEGELNLVDPWLDQDNVFSSEKEGLKNDRDDSNSIVQSARELLRSVERTLSQTDAEVNKLLTDQDQGEVKPYLDTKVRDSQSHGMLTEHVMSENSSATVIDDSDSNEASIYDIHRSSSSTETNESDKCHAKSSETSEQEALVYNGELNETRIDRTDTLKDFSQNSCMCSESNDSTLGSKSSRSSTLTENNVRKSTPPVKLSLKRMNSKELSRSASMEHELTSPPRSRQRTVSDVFKDMEACTPESLRIPETCIKQWIAEIVVAVGKLHADGIICRDLKPDNILLGDRGHVILTYFCQLNQVDQELDYSAVEELFVAPEVNNIGGYTESCDWWSLGTLMYELLVGRSLSSCHPGGITCHTLLYIPDHVSAEAHGLLQQLLCYNSRERLGSGMNGAEDIKSHPFFSGIDWNQLEA